jgi:hypothetical protein
MQKVQQGGIGRTGMQGEANIQDYLLASDGVDHTPAFQRAINALPGAGRIIIPPGVWNVGNLYNWGKSVIFQGAGWGVSAGGLPGCQQYRNTAAMNGSILYCIAKSGACLNFPLSFSVNSRVRDLAVIGAGLPGVAGVDLANNVNLENVLVAGFDSGIIGRDLVGNHFSDVWVRGCNAGWSFTHCTLCQLDRCVATWCAGHALKMTWSFGFLLNTFDSETNRCSEPEISLTDDGDPTHGCRQNTFQSLWAESPDNKSGLLLDIWPSTHDTEIRQLNVHGGTAQKIRDRGVGTIIGPMYSWPWGGGDRVIEATGGAANAQ